MDTEVSLTTPFECEIIALFDEFLHVMTGSGLAAVTLHLKVTLLPSLIFMSPETSMTGFTVRSKGNLQVDEISLSRDYSAHRHTDS